MSGKADGLLDLVTAGDRAGLERALAEGAEAHAKNEIGVSLLYAAAERGDLAMVELLLAQGARADDATDAGNTPLMAATARGHREVVARLLAAGADPQRRNRWGYDARSWAVWGKDPEELRALLESARKD